MLFRVFKIFLIFFISSMLTIFFIKLSSFKEKILSINKNNAEISNIIILTGGTNRIKDGLKIIDDLKKSETINFKILVSGTGKGFTKNSLKKQLGPNFNSKLIECCIELDSVSTNTFSNAVESLKWTQKNNIKEFILITSNYHMPRAFLEFKNTMPNLKIHTFSITPKKLDVGKWLYSYQTFSLIFKEFCKYIVANVRIKILSI